MGQIWLVARCSLLVAASIVEMIGMAKIGIVLAGGFAKGAYQLGVLNAIEQTIPTDEVVCVSSASVGSLGAYAYVTGRMREAEEGWMSMNFSGLRKFTQAVMYRPLLSDAISNVHSEGDVLRIPLYVACFNLSKMVLEYVDLRNALPCTVEKYMQATMSVPAFFKPVHIGGYEYYDGGLIDNIPVMALKEFDTDYIIVVHFDNYNHHFESREMDSRIIKLNFLDDGFIKDMFSFDSKSVRMMIDRGYTSAMKLFETFFAHGTNDIPYILNCISERNEVCSQDKYRLTSDVVISNFNKLQRRIVTKKYNH